MAYNETLAEKIRNTLKGTKGITEKKMFGGLCFLHNGNMLCGIDNQDRLMVRVGSEQYETALSKKHAMEMDFTGRPLKGMIYVNAEGYKTKLQLNKWVEMGITFTKSLPKKAAKPKKKKPTKI